MVRPRAYFLHRCQCVCRAAQHQACSAFPRGDTGEERTRQVPDRRVSCTREQCALSRMFPIVASACLVFVSVCPTEKGMRLESGCVRSNRTLARVEPGILHRLELPSEHHAQWSIPSEVSSFCLLFSPIYHSTLSTPEDNNDLLANELSMTMAALRQHPKVYWIWNHRRWCLENVPDGPVVDGKPSLQWRKANWQRELAVVEKMLDADARNCKPTHISFLIRLNPPSSCLELPEICFGKHARSETHNNRVGVHHAQNWRELL